jgi:hypothetical protein
MASFSSSSSKPKSWVYDVFLSFRGVDTREAFTDHLYAALNCAGVRTFRDSEGLRRGKEISASLMRAIEESRICLIVFSETYANSRWCLDELVHIMECRDTLGQMVLPIFYRVDPSHVRRQTATFAKAFQEHEARHDDDGNDVDTNIISRWRSALQKAANLSGWHLNTDQ